MSGKQVPVESSPVTDALRKAEVIHLLMDTGAAARGIIEATLRDNGAPSSASDTMWVIATSVTPITPREIAAKLGRDPSTVTLTADKLEAAGIVTRGRHPTDGRKRTLSLTDHGHDLWDAMRGRLHASNMFTDLSTEQQCTLLELLRLIR